MSVAFVRQLGAEAGVQLNPLRDNSEIPTVDNADQVLGIMMRATRGRIDKPFKVDRGNVYQKLGPGEPVRVSALNTAWVHVVEALNKGAFEAVVQRLVTTAAAVKWAKAIVAVDNAITYAVDAQPVPQAPYLFAIRHLECFNDGIKVEYHADEKRASGSAVPNDVITVRILDAKDAVLYEFTGSLNPAAKDDYGQSLYLPDVVQNRTDAVELVVGATGVDADVNVASLAYGYDSATGKQQWSRSSLLSCFDEGGTAYQTSDYIAARGKLQNTAFDYEYISSGGSASSAVLAQLAQLAFDTNRQLRYDVQGNLTPDEVVTFVEALNMGASPTAHLLQAFWMPIKSDDPTGINPNTYIGTATLNIAYACGRNAQTDNNGFAPKNYVVAGRDWPVQRTGMRQTYTPSEQELDKLARVKVNPVLFDTFTGGSRCVFRDSLTSALVDSSLKKLISVADMSSDIDKRVTKMGKDRLQLPMDIAVKKMRDDMKAMFEGAEAAKWVVPSSDPTMAGKAWRLDVRPNAVRPYDRMDVSYWVRYDGTVRQMFVTQTLTR